MCGFYHQGQLWVADLLDHQYRAWCQLPGPSQYDDLLLGVSHYHAADAAPGKTIYWNYTMFSSKNAHHIPIISLWRITRVYMIIDFDAPQIKVRKITAIHRFNIWGFKEKAAWWSILVFKTKNCNDFFSNTNSNIEHRQKNWHFSYVKCGLVKYGSQ